MPVMSSASKQASRRRVVTRATIATPLTAANDARPSHLSNAALASVTKRRLLHLSFSPTCSVTCHLPESRGCDGFSARRARSPLAPRRPRPAGPAGWRLPLPRPRQQASKGARLPPSAWPLQRGLAPPCAGARGLARAAGGPRSSAGAARASFPGAAGAWASRRS